MLRAALPGRKRQPGTVGMRSETIERAVDARCRGCQRGIGPCEDYVVLAHIACMYRYPIKGLSAEALHAVELAAGEGLPLDRKFALA
jgi:hypothetical protein